MSLLYKQWRRLWPAKQDDNLLLDDELTAAFLGSDDSSIPEPDPVDSDDTVATATATAATDDTWEDSENLMGQLAVDVFETENELVIKARTAGVDRDDLDVSISDGILTISGTLSSGDETDVHSDLLRESFRVKSAAAARRSVRSDKSFCNYAW